MAGNALVPDALRDSDNRLAPSVTSTGEPDPNSTAGWIQIYRDWKARGVDMPPLADWLKGAGSEYANALLMGSTAPGMRGPVRIESPIRPLYHGSKGSFDAFSDAHIGSGEGAQAFGYGHYVAEAPGTGDYYRQTLAGSGKRITMPDGTTAQGAPSTFVQPLAESMRDVPGGFGMKMAIARAHLDGTSMQPADLAKDFWGDLYGTKSPADIAATEQRFAGILPKAQPALAGVKAERPGHSYELAVHADPEHFLQWDKPLTEQSPHVQKAMAEHPELSAVLQAQDLSDVATAGDWVKRTTKDPRTAEMDPAELSKLLQSAGIPGIKYLDQISRGAGEGSHNYVVFDPATIEILRKYGLAGLGLGTAATAATQGTDQTQ